MKRGFYVLLCISALCALALAACAPAGNPFVLAGTSWTLVSYGPASAQIPAVSADQTSLVFDEQRRLKGNAGCNSFGSDVKLDGNTMIFGVMMSTMMACPGQVMDQEQAVLGVLKEKATFQLDGTRLTITALDGKTAAVFRQAGK